jgi:hypothetical protein
MVFSFVHSKRWGFYFGWCQKILPKAAISSFGIFTFGYS